jgi:glycosyltransferase involved in cell wall biosynthesis
MLRGEEGNQSRELQDLIGWLKQQPRPDVVCLSNVMLLGMARELRRSLDRPVVCMLQGEDYFLDSLPQPHRDACWQTLVTRAKDVDMFIAPSQYFADLMRGRLSLPADRVKVVYNGINLEGFTAGADGKAGAPIVGYLARLCPEKGLELLVNAFILLRQRHRIPEVRLRAVGSLGPADEPFVEQMKQRLAAAGLAKAAEFHPNVNRSTKLALLESFSVFSVPAVYGEAFGLYVIESLAAGVPVVQPKTAAFPELIELTGGGLLCSPGDAEALASALETLLVDIPRARNLGSAGRRAVFEQFSADAMALRFLQSLQHFEGCAVPAGSAGRA